MTMTREEDKEKAGHDWSELPSELLVEIGQRVILLKEKIRIRAVCRTWRRDLAQQLPLLFRQSSPTLILPYCSINSNKGEDAGGGCVSQECRLLRDVAHNQRHHISFGEGLEEATCRGSAFGWLFMLQRTPVLFNPLSRDQISLPPITTFPEVLDYCLERVGEEYLLQSSDGSKVVAGKRYLESIYVQRIAMSAEPTSEDCVVMALCIRDQLTRLAFCKPGDDKWTLIPQPNGEPFGFANVVFCGGNFYANDNRGRVLICDLTIPKLSFLVTEADIVCLNSYLLMGPDDELMFVSRLAEEEDIVLGVDDDDSEVNAAGIYNGFPIPHVHHVEEEEEGQGQEEEEEEVDNNGLAEDIAGVEEDGLGPLEEEEEVDGHEEDAAGMLYIRDSDELLQAPWMYWTFDFRVYKLNKDTNEWDQVQTIGDYALFLGTNSPACLSTKDNLGLKSNCIYFTDDNFNSHFRHRHGGHDMGIYHLSDDTIESFYCTNSNRPFLVWPPPVWVSRSIY
ncbi:unnamed protein product [Linum trigynum]|uniref:KIB1-4 beta-propeller domain-containing protein n=1 Tax=Linum trigynum TaxID=586398 RepID=A0AAV2GIJ6_9ROSI